MMTAVEIQLGPARTTPIGGRMRLDRTSLVVAIAAALGIAGCVPDNQAATPAAANVVKGGSDETGEYMAAANWWKPYKDHTEGCQPGLNGGSGGVQAGGGGGGGGGQRGGAAAQRPK